MTAATMSDDQADDIIDAVEQDIGMGTGAWDMVNPKDLVHAFARALLAARPEQWIDDPHDIEQGKMLNPAWLAANGLLSARKYAAAEAQPAVQPIAALASELAAIGAADLQAWDSVQPAVQQPSHIHDVYDKLHAGKLGAHWLWVVIEQIAAGVPEADAMREFGYYAQRPAKDARHEAKTVEVRWTEFTPGGHPISVVEDRPVAASPQKPVEKVPREPLSVEDVKAAVRQAGGIVHGDGNIFFTNAEQLFLTFVLLEEDAPREPTLREQSLAMTIRMLYAYRKSESVRANALKLLDSFGLQGSPLRTGGTDAA